MAPSGRSYTVLGTQASSTDQGGPSFVRELEGPSLDSSFRPPISITKGGVFTGNWQSTNSNVPVIRIATDEPVVIENSVLRGPGHLIFVDHNYAADLTVRNTVGIGMVPNSRGRPPGRFVNAESFSNLVIENNRLLYTAGIYSYHWLGGGTLRIRFNRARNIIGLVADGAGGWLSEDGAHPRAHLVQFAQINSVHGIESAEIAWNEIINEPYVSRVEDVISLYDSSGTASFPIRIHDNYIQGAYPARPEAQTYSGGGIMLGDGNGSYQEAFDNQVVSSANYGIAISGGSHNRIFDNVVISSGMLADGTIIAASNVGIYIWNSGRVSNFGPNSGSGNTVGYASFGKDGIYRRNDWYVPDAATWADNNAVAGRIDLDMEAQEQQRWVEKYIAASVHIGIVGDEQASYKWDRVNGR